ncbi:hypothetical protein WJX74_006789 [Apatococcus lobatus]|uniref:thioredoxin-dependent peroxiredoxin n=1 Tax=Apatococcus lobatus TaxID=904363 RepID=A0AAW1S632_9CHLO
MIASQCGPAVLAKSGSKNCTRCSMPGLARCRSSSSLRRSALSGCSLRADVRVSRAQIDTTCRALKPLVGYEAPDFVAQAVFDQEFQTVTLSQFRGQYVILMFYPLDFTFVCPTELVKFSDRASEFRDINCQVMGISVDSQFSHLAWTQQDRREGGVGELQYPLVSDIKREISDKYGVLTDDGVALRGLFIIDKEGIIQHSTINNLAFGRSVEEAKRTLQAIQYVQENPDEVCPAGWQPGSNTMKPTPKDSKEYFAAL